MSARVISAKANVSEVNVKPRSGGRNYTAIGAHSHFCDEFQYRPPFCCHLHASAQIASSPRAARHFSTVLARAGSA